MLCATSTGFLHTSSPDSFVTNLPVLFLLVPLANQPNYPFAIAQEPMYIPGLYVKPLLSPHRVAIHVELGGHN